MKWKKKICIGTPQFSGFYGITNENKKNFKLRDINDFFKLLKKNRINYIDTALAYKKAEKNIISSKANISKFNIITKIPRPNKLINYEEAVIKKISQSQKKFRIRKFYSILLHDCKNLQKSEIKKVLNIFRLLKKKNLTKYVGFSIYSTQDYKKIIRYFKPDILQVPGNIFDRTFLTKNFLNEIKKKKIKLHVRSIFLQGIILSDMQLINKKFKRWKNIFHSWEKFCQYHNSSKIEIATNFLFNYPLIDKIIVGFNNKNQFLEFLKIKKLNLKIPNFINKDKKSIEKLIKPYNWNLK